MVHFKAVAKTAMGMGALLELGMRLVRGHWDPQMRDGRLAALNKPMARALVFKC